MRSETLERGGLVFLYIKKSMETILFLARPETFFFLFS